MRAALVLTLAVAMVARSQATMLDKFIIDEKVAEAQALMNERHIGDKVAEEIGPVVAAKIDKLDPAPAKAIFCPPGEYAANPAGPCLACGVGFWCPGGFQSEARRVACANGTTTVSNNATSPDACVTAGPISCPPGQYAANPSGPCVACGIGFWCAGGVQSQPGRVPCANGTTTTTDTATSPAACQAGGGGSNYSIAIINTGPALTAEVQDAITAAVNKWTSVIVGDVPGISGRYTIPADQCDNAEPITLPNGVEDMLILVNVGPIADDQVLGYGGVCSVDKKTNTANIGFLTINSNFVPDMIKAGILDDVILHEFGHCQGYGTLWRKAGFWDCGPQDESTGTSARDTYFSCQNARTQFNAVGGGSYVGNKVPLQNEGDEGSINYHWRESVFGNELMTPYVNVTAGTVSPLSVVTVGSFEDIGHVVNYAAADPYTLGKRAAPEAAKDAMTFSLANDIKPVPIQVTSTDAEGRTIVEAILKPSTMFSAETLKAWGLAE